MRNRGFGPSARQLTRCFTVPLDRVAPVAVQEDALVMDDAIGMSATAGAESAMAFSDALADPTVRAPESRVGYARVGHGEVTYNLDDVQRTDSMALTDTLAPSMEPTPFTSDLGVSDTLDVTTAEPVSAVGAARVGYAEVA